MQYFCEQENNIFSQSCSGVCVKGCFLHKREGRKHVIEQVEQGDLLRGVRISLLP